MRFTITIIFFLCVGTFVKGQEINWDWYSETTNNGIIIQNSFPKGGPYTGPTKKYFNHSYLVFFTRVINETDKPFELSLNFSADSIPIPNSPDTYMKLFLPPNKMTLEKQVLFSYGLTELGSFDKATSFQKTINPKEDCLFYVVAFFYQTKKELWKSYRGGNRAELVLKGQELFYRIPPQLDLMPCGRIIIID
ncbi:MAG: hypothetical protein AAFO07_31500 [Bacteroidota bacterium]